MSRRFVRLMLVITVLVATIATAAWYFVKHPAVKHQLAQTPHSTIALLLGLYLIFVATMALIMHASLLLCNARLGARESLLLTMYSSIINFFGPLQSGPAFRAVYLKKRHGIKLKNYTVATLVYYFFYGGISTAMLLSSVLRWWLVVGAAATLLILLLAKRSSKPSLQRFFALNLAAVAYLGAATAAQVLMIVVIYFVELHAVGAHASLGQAITYTGAANLALFVSITPGAIGFRESFLLFSRHLHHVSSSAIVAASLVDRSVYIILLIFLAIVIFGTHAQRELTNTTDD